jgi:tetratricopeptide (TPR) repeat protein
LEQAKTEAEKWRNQYEQLLTALSSANISDGLRDKAQTLLVKGDLNGASKLLDDALEAGNSELSRLASMQFTRGLIAELQFDEATALVHYERAYALLPDNVFIAFSYGNLLVETGSYLKAADIFKALLDRRASLPGGKEGTAATLENLAGIDLSLQRLDDAEKAYESAAQLFGEVAADGSLEARRNEASAFMGMANLDLLQGNHEQALSSAKKSIDLCRSGIDKDGKGTDQLAGMLAEYADISSQSGNNQDAINSVKESIHLWNGPLAIFPGYPHPDRIARAGLAHALEVECGALGRSGDITGAAEAAQEALSIYQRLAADEPEKYRLDLAGTYLSLGVTNIIEHKMVLALGRFKEASHLCKDMESTGRKECDSTLAQALSYSAVAEFALGNSGDAIKDASESVSVVTDLRKRSSQFSALFEQISNNAIGIYTRAHETQKASDLADLKNRLNRQEQ